MKTTCYQIIFIFMILNSCGIDPQKAPQSTLTRLKSQNTELSYFNVNEQVLKNKCLACHQSNNNTDLSTYAKVALYKSEIDEVIRNRSMPPSGPLPEYQQKLLLDWIASGAPEFATNETENSNNPSEKPNPDSPTDSTTSTTTTTTLPNSPPLQPTYESMTEKFLTAKCNSCHSPGGKAEESDFSTYNSLRSQDFIFDRENPENSRIIKLVRKTGAGAMPPSKSGIARMTEEEILVLTEWIRLGFPEK